MTARPRLLDLGCHKGGATYGYQQAGFYVVGVDIKPQPGYCGDDSLLVGWRRFGLGWQCRPCPRCVPDQFAKRGSAP